MRTAALLIALALTATAGANIVDMPLDSLDPAGYFTVAEDMGCNVIVEGDRTFIRTDNLNANGATFHSPIINFEIYTGGTVDASPAGATLEFDVRYYEEGPGENGEYPYDPGQCELDVTLFDVNGSSFTWIDAFNNPEPHGEWHHLSLNLADTAGNPSFDLGQLSSMEFVGYNSRWCWQDHVDLDTLSIVPEPATLALFGLALAGLLRRSR